MHMTARYTSRCSALFQARLADAITRPHAKPLEGVRQASGALDDLSELSLPRIRRVSASRSVTTFLDPCAPSILRRMWWTVSGKSIIRPGCGSSRSVTRRANDVFDHQHTPLAGGQAGSPTLVPVPHDRRAVISGSGMMCPRPRRERCERSSRPAGRSGTEGTRPWGSPPLCRCHPPAVVHPSRRSRRTPRALRGRGTRRAGREAFAEHDERRDPAAAPPSLWTSTSWASRSASSCRPPPSARRRLDRVEDAVPLSRPTSSPGVDVEGHQPCAHPVDSSEERVLAADEIDRGHLLRLAETFTADRAEPGRRSMNVRGCTHRPARRGVRRRKGRPW